MKTKVYIMKSVLYSLLVVFTLNFSILNGGELKVSPIVQPGKEISIEYKHSDDDQFNDPYVVVYTFTKKNVKPFAHQQKLGSNGKTEFTVPSDAVFLMYKVTDGKKTDDNGTQFWHSSVSANGKVVEYSNFRAAVSYLGQLPENCRRSTSLSKAEEFLSLELKEYPNNPLAQAGLAMLHFDSKSLSKPEFDGKIKSIFSSKSLDWSQEEINRSAWRSFRAIGSYSVSDSIAKGYVLKFPYSELAEDYGLDYLRTLKVESQIIDSAYNYLMRFPHTKEAPMLAQGLAPMAASQNRLKEVMTRYETTKHRNAFAVSMFAFILVDNDSTQIPDAIEYLTKEIKVLAKSGTDDFKPKWMAPIEWNDQGASMITQLKATRGFLYERAQNKKAAIADLEEVVSLYPNTCHEVIFDKLVSLLHEGNYDVKKANYWAGKAIELSKANENVKKIHKETHSVSENSGQQYEKVLESLKSKSTESRRKSLKKSMLQQSAPDGNLIDMKGEKIPLSSLRGKTVIIDFWATWCGPCRASFPAMQKLYTLYKDDPNVAFVIANCWERSDDKKKTVTDFLAKNSYTFPVYFDENDGLAKAFGVTGIPAKFFVSPNGKIQFKESGFQGEEKFLEDGTDKIELLKLEK